MSHNQFQTILEFAHFNDNNKYDPNNANRDQLFRVGPLVEHLVTKSKEVYTLSKIISIDEELMLWKGHLQFKQYIPKKHSRFGIKYFSLCEAAVYMWNSFVCPGNKKNVSEEESRLGISGSVILKLMSELYHKGYHADMNNWYTSEKLFKHLEANSTVAFVTARKC